MPGLLRINLLGEMQVLLDGQPLALPQSKKTRALLAYLATTAKPQRRERLCEIFWDIPDDPRGALRWSLSKLRQVGGKGDDSLITADRNTVKLNPQAFTCDLTAVASLKEAEIERLDVAALEAIAGEFRGDFIEDLYLPNCPTFEAWRIAEADHLGLIRLRVLRLLVERIGDDPARALRYAHLLKALAPDDEPGLAARIDELTAAARVHAPEPAPAAERKPATRSATATPATAPAQAPATETVDQSRRQVSAVAVEIISPLADAPGSDPEADYTAIAPRIQAICGEIERHGGILISATDASIVGVFGVGASSEDHAIQSCRAALALAGLGRRGLPPIGLRVGLDSGEAVVRRERSASGMRAEAHGAVLRTARQLAQALRRDTIACSERVRDAAGPAMKFVSLAASDVDAGRLPGQGLELVGENKMASRWHLRRARGLTPMIGREHELRWLEEASAGVTSGEGQAVGIVGDAGIGKSRLLHEFVTSRVTDAYTLIECGAAPGEATASLRMVKKLVRALLSIGEDEPAISALAKVNGCAAQLGGDGSVVTPLLFALDLPSLDQAWQGFPPAERIRRTRNAILSVLMQEARKAPLILLIEDLHWIDRESQAVIDSLIDGIINQPILMVTTYRPEFQPAWLGKDNFRQLRVPPLSDAEASALLSTVLGRDGSVRRVARIIADRSDGVPLFIEESIQALAQSGALVGSTGTYRTEGEIADLRVPSTVQSVIAARIDRLSDEDRALLQSAACLGRDIAADILASVARVGPDAIAEQLAALQRAGFIYETQVLPTPVFQFKHALVQKVAYESLLQSDRQRVHRQVVDALERDFPHLVEGDIEGLAEHAIAAEYWDKAVSFLQRSAARALQRSAYAQALSFIEKGMAILNDWPDGPTRNRAELELQKLAGVAWMAAKGWSAEEVLTTYERAEVLCDTLKDETERFTALRGRAQYYMISGQPRNAQEIALRCADMTKGGTDTGTTLETHHMFWTNNFFMGNCVETETHALAGIKLYEPGQHHALTYRYSGHDPGVCSHCFAGLSAWQRGSFASAAEHCRFAVTHAEKLAHPLSIGLAHWALSLLHIFHRQPEPALKAAQREISMCDEYLLPLLRSQGGFQIGWALAALGDKRHGIAEMERGVAGIRASGAEMGLPYFLALLAETIAGTGDAARAVSILEEATSAAMRNGTHFQFSELLRIRASIMLQTDRRNVAEADALLARAVAFAQNQGADMPAFQAATMRAQLLTDQKRQAEADALLAPFAHLAGEMTKAGAAAG